MTTKPLKSLLEDGSSPLNRLVSRASAMQSLCDVVTDSVDADHASHITDVNVSEENVLVVVADSAAWAARLRFQTDALLSAARAHGIQAAQCKVRVRPVRQTPGPDKTPGR